MALDIHKTNSKQLLELEFKKTTVSLAGNTKQSDTKGENIMSLFPVTRDFNNVIFQKDFMI